jgi:hypothetical protein
MARLYIGALSAFLDAKFFSLVFRAFFAFLPFHPIFMSKQIVNYQKHILKNILIFMIRLC